MSKILKFIFFPLVITVIMATVMLSTGIIKSSNNCLMRHASFMYHVAVVSEHTNVSACLPCNLALNEVSRSGNGTS